MNSKKNIIKCGNSIGSFDRRRFLRASVTALAGTLLPGSLLLSCAKKQPAIRIASNIWPGYELLFVARDLNIFNKEQIRMVEMPSASVCLESLAAGTVEGACLTLDEVLTARSSGLDIKVVTVLDVSMGADVVLASSQIKNLQDLKGRRVGVEQSAVGAVMLYSALERAGLKVSDLKIKHMNVNRHRDAFLKKEVDALVTFEPVVSQLATHGINTLFTSADIPGRIVDVIAVRADVIETRPEAVRKLVEGHFSALDIFQKTPQEVAPLISQRLKLKPEDVLSAYKGIELPNASENRKLLQGRMPGLETSVRTLSQIMTDARLLPTIPDIVGIVDGRFIPNS